MNRPTEGIATDASHSMKYGKTRFRGIDLKSGVEIFHEDSGNQTVNAGEFLGIVAAAKYIVEHESTLLFKAEVFLQIMSAIIDRIEVRHWDNDLWGEIPADFGLK